MDSPAALDPAALAATLRSLASPVRLRLLQALVYPHQLGEIRVTPARRQAGQKAERPAARQTVQMHLDRLVEAGFLRIRSGRAPQYVVDQGRLYGFLEDLRQLAALQGSHVTPTDLTGSSPAPPSGSAADGPRLVLVHGAFPGKAFPLQGAAPWVVGRRKGAAVALDYDPYVSQDHCAVAVADGRFSVRDLGSKNGTYVNWRRLPDGGAQALRAGDVVGVGRSLLCLSGA